MMADRIIKFRAWLKNHSIMVNVWQINYAEFNNNTIQSIGSSMVVNETYIFKIEDVELMQYAGLKDRNCKEIYEGDILSFMAVKTGYNIMKNRMNIGLVNYYLTGFNIKYVERKKENNPPLYYYADEIEIIGNIYETPELCKKLHFLY